MRHSGGNAQKIRVSSPPPHPQEIELREGPFNFGEDPILTRGYREVQTIELDNGAKYHGEM